LTPPTGWPIWYCGWLNQQGGLQLMTIDCTSIESILEPLRKFDSYDNRMISLRSIGFAANPFAPPERRQAWRAIGWSETSKPPVSDWLGNVEGSTSHAEILQRMRVVPFIAFMDMVPVLAKGHPWCLLDHQAGGHACSHLRFLGRRVSLKPEIEFGCLRIASQWYGKQLGSGQPSLSELMEYRAQLQEIDLDCNSAATYRFLTEAFYPIDLSQAVIDRICLQPFSLESVLGHPKPYGSVGHMAILAIVAPNSD
jgi:hypothetical protein